MYCFSLKNRVCHPRSAILFCYSVAAPATAVLALPYTPYTLEKTKIFDVFFRKPQFFAQKTQNFSRLRCKIFRGGSGARSPAGGSSTRASVYLTFPNLALREVLELAIIKNMLSTAPSSGEKYVFKGGPRFLS